MKENNLSNYIQKVFLWMFLGLVTTAITAFVVANNEGLLATIFSNVLNLYLLFGLELVCVIVIGRLKHKLSSTFLLVLFLVYAVINGLTLSVIFLAYQLGSIALIFGITSLLFGGLALYGYVTKKDMTKIGHICLVTLLVMLVATLINIFLKNSLVDLILTIVGIAIFFGLTVYDMQKIKRFYVEDDEENNKKLAIYGALELYLDFINLFIRLLSLLGKRK